MESTDSINENATQAEYQEALDNCRQAVDALFTFERRQTGKILNIFDDDGKLLLNINCDSSRGSESINYQNHQIQLLPPNQALLTVYNSQPVSRDQNEDGIVLITTGETIPFSKCITVINEVTAIIEKFIAEKKGTQGPPSSDTPPPNIGNAFSF